MDPLALGAYSGMLGAEPAAISDSTYVLAIFIAMVISCFQSLGMGLQKRVHLELAALPPDAPRQPYFKHARWLAGLGAMTTASLMVIVNYTLLGQSRASAFAALSVVTNCVMAKYYLRENFTRYDAAAAALILSGVAVCAIFGASAGTGTVPLHDLVAVLSRPAVYAASALALAAVAAMTAVVRFAKARGAGRSRAVHSAECAARAVIGGIFSGSTGFFMKGVTSGVSSSFRAPTDAAPNPFYHTVGDSLAYGFFYVFLLGLPLSLVFQLRTLNAGLANFEAVEFVPMYQAALVVIGVGWGWVFYQEDQDLNNSQVGLFALGCCISVAGIVVLSFKPSAAGKKGGAGEGEAAPLLARASSDAEAPGVGLLTRDATLNPFGRAAAPSGAEAPLLKS
jgi:hypothetical protein